MRVKTRAVLVGVLIATLLVALITYLAHHNLPVLQPAGSVGQKERNLIVFAGLLALVVVIPVYFMLFSFAWRYREGNKSARHEPNFDHSPLLETIWWAVPTTLILILAVVTWRSSHELDPFKPLSSSVAPTKIQVVALDWRWLFIYPELGTASVNQVEFPVNVPVQFNITADAPMNSFWIPALGGQIYAMSGMSTQLNLQANQIGSYRGSSANISGEGFAKMNFEANAVSQTDYNAWQDQLLRANNVLSSSTYSQMAKPSLDSQVAYFKAVAPGLYESIVDKFLGPNLEGGHH